MAAEQGLPVELYVYDLSHGLASVLSPTLIGRQVEGVWHTAVVVYGREYFYGGAGVTSCSPGSTQLGAPHQVERLGETFVPFGVFDDYVQGLATSTYTGSAYRLLEHNCNHFSDEVAQFLCGARVPKHIARQPDALPAPLRLALSALLDNLVPDAGRAQAVYASGVRHSRQESPDYRTLNTQIEEARARRCVALLGGLVRAALPPVIKHVLRLFRPPPPPPPQPVQSAALGQRRATLAEKMARKERRKEKKRKKLHAPPDERFADELEMSEAVETAPGREELPGARAGPSSGALEEETEADERRREEERKRARDPPVVYKDIDGASEYEKLCTALQGLALGEEERQSLDELQQYLVLGEGSWVLGDEFLTFVGRLLSDPGVSAEARVCAMRCLCACALRDDVSLLLHQDRRHHALLTYANRIDRHSSPEQHAIALFMCNLFENISSSEWLLYISEWEADGQPLSNIRATTKVCVHALLSESLELRELGTALAHNVATKEVFDEVCVELAMAVLQLLQWAPAEEHMFRACKALARLAQHSAEVPQLIAIVGPDPAAFRGTSARVDEQIDAIMKKVK